MIIKKHSKMPARYIDAVLAEELLKQGYGIVEVPTEDVAPVVHGKWIERWHENKHVIGDMACSVCGTQMLLTFPKFCPECGAKMDGGEKEDNEYTKKIQQIKNM